MGLSNGCLNISLQLYSSPVFRLYRDIPTLHLDRLNVSYAIFHRFCQAWGNLYPVLRGNGVIKQPGLSFLLKRRDTFNPRLFSVSFQLPGYLGAQSDTLHKFQHFFK